ncbi:MFS general substrate transporter [Gloeopeniophorella convolvens]|nr:MFS general substrate transporter [Gloeopeniophorella convolvens]
MARAEAEVHSDLIVEEERIPVGPPRPAQDAPVELPASAGDRKGAEIPERPFSSFNHREKWIIVNLASFAALFSPLTSSIYLPAIPIMARDFHKSTELINLTVTMYMVMQGIAPMVWGTLSDIWGRRPIMTTCLVILPVACVGLALVPTSDYWLLMLLRCIQATGSASTIALGAGIISDIATPAERGGFIGVFMLGPMVGPNIGPVIGGGLAQGFGWRANFWFLCISSSVCGLGLFLIIPETLRSIVGDGTIRAPWIYTPPIPIIGKHRVMKDVDERPPRKPFTNPLVMFTYPDVAILLLFNSVFSAVFNGVLASISTLFQETYPYLNTTDVGLCFLALGGGMILGSTFSGSLMDARYRKIKDELVRRARVNAEKEVDVKALVQDVSFPIEKARMQVVPYVIAVMSAAVAGYGWCLQARVTIVIPLILQVIIGATSITVMNSVQALLVDLVPNQGSSITGCNNLVRCLLGATVISVINPMLNGLGKGWTFVLFGGWCIAASPLMFAVVRWGPMWRAQRHARLQRAIEKRSAP